MSELREKNNFFIFCILYVIIILIFLKQISYFNLIYSDIESISTIIFILFRILYIFIVISWGRILISNRLKIDVFILVIFTGISILLTLIFFPQNRQFIMEVYPYIVYCMTAYSIIRSRLIELKDVEKYVVFVSRIVIILIFFSLSSTLNWITSTVYMNFSDATALITAFLLYSGIAKNKKIDFLLGLLGLVSILVFGSRGASLTLLLLVILLYFFINRRFVWKKTLLLSSIFTTGVIFRLLLPQIYLFLSGMNIYTRPLELLMQAQVFESEGRILLFTRAFEVISSNWLLGVGVAGDRYHLRSFSEFGNTVYVHNIILEIIMHFGLIIGSIIITVIFYNVIKKFLFSLKFTPSDKCFISVFFTLSFLQLFISRSYIVEVHLFIFMALIINNNKNSLVEGKDSNIVKE